MLLTRFDAKMGWNIHIFQCGYMRCDRKLEGEDAQSPYTYTYTVHKIPEMNDNSFAIAKALCSCFSSIRHCSLGTLECPPYAKKCSET